MYSKEELIKIVRTVPDFPIKGVMFKDICPVLFHHEAFAFVIDWMIEKVKKMKPTAILGPEARGFIFGIPLAWKLKIPFYVARKPGKLPRETICKKVITEYSQTTLCVHKEDIKSGEKFVIIDDILATGGTIQSCAAIIEEMNSETSGAIFMAQLDELKEQRQKFNFPTSHLVNL